VIYTVGQIPLVQAPVSGLAGTIFTRLKKYITVFKHRLQPRSRKFPASLDRVYSLQKRFPRRACLLLFASSAGRPRRIGSDLLAGSACLHLPRSARNFSTGEIAMQDRANPSYGTSTTEIDAQLQKLLCLLGTWIGKGKGEFPTIQSFEYQEKLTFKHLAGTPYITYEQSTGLLNPDGSTKPSHWESGILRPKEDGIIVMSSVHDSTRTEVMHGEIDTSATLPGLLSIKFQSINLANDPRMVASRREFFVSGSELKYTMGMATQRTPNMTHHLSATLNRSKR
jgi:hypothetical protein